MVLMSNIQIPVLAIREYIENAIDIVIYIERLQDGKRKITSISEVYNMKDGDINLKEIFAFKQNGLTKSGEVNGSYVMYSYIPKVYNKIKSKGIDDVDDIFEAIKKEKDSEKENNKKKKK
jgi:pilus assembly protein CpaF